MTPLDQAFAKAFSLRDPSRILPPHATRAVPLGEALGRPIGRRVAVPAAVADGQLLEALNRAPSQPKAQPSGSVPRPHFLLRRDHSEPEREPEPEPAAVAETPWEPQAPLQPEPELPIAAAEPKPEEPAVAHEEPAAVSPDECLESPIAPPAEFTPGLQVDHFAWPKVCNRLAAAAEGELGRLAGDLRELVAGRRKVVAVAAASRGEGATSVLLCVAQRLALSGVPTVAVDGDLVRPQLGSMLGLAPAAGWEEVLAGREPLEEVLIQSIDDRLVVLPLQKAVSPSSDLPGRIAQSLATLCGHYEAVLVNLGPPDDWWVLGDLVDRRLAEQIGLLVVVCDTRQSDGQLDRLCRKANAAGIDQIVLVENFVAGSQSLAPSP